MNKTFRLTNRTSLTSNPRAKLQSTGQKNHHVTRIVVAVLTQSIPNTVKLRQIKVIPPHQRRRMNSLQVRNKMSKPAVKFNKKFNKKTSALMRETIQCFNTSKIDILFKQRETKIRRKRNKSKSNLRARKRTLSRKAHNRWRQCLLQSLEWHLT